MDKLRILFLLQKAIYRCIPNAKCTYILMDVPSFVSLLQVNQIEAVSLISLWKSHSKPNLQQNVLTHRSAQTVIIHQPKLSGHSWNASKNHHPAGEVGSGHGAPFTSHIRWCGAPSAGMCYGRGSACRKQLLEACDLGVAVLAWTEVAPKHQIAKHIKNIWKTLDLQLCFQSRKFIFQSRKFLTEGRKFKLKAHKQ